MPDTSSTSAAPIEGTVTVSSADLLRVLLFLREQTGKPCGYLTCDSLICTAVRRLDGAFADA